jgi:hypothetical protein
MSDRAPSEQPTVVPLAVPTAEAATLTVNNGAPPVPPAVTPIANYEILGELGRGGRSATPTYTKGMGNAA